MIKNSYKVIGLMSGTSLDGLDLAFCDIALVDGNWKFHILASKSVDYDDSLKNRLKQSVQLTALDLLLLNNEYGSWLGEQVVKFVQENQLEVDFVSSHGHTVFHQPEKGLTYQIGSGQHLANICGIDVVCDFRTKDLTLGGQGAPLVPIGDEHFLSEYDFCLNLGGISNISFTHKGERVAYDIGLANMVLNHLTNPEGISYDAFGDIARTGKLSKPLFDQLNELPYHKLPFPKSTGYEWFCEQVIPIVDHSTDRFQDKLCTCVHHIAFQVAKEVGKFSNAKSRMLVTGGGAHNTFLIEKIRSYLDDKIEVVIPDESIIDFKEAIVFALMGVLRWRGEVNCLRSVTGARSDSSAGVIYHPA